MSASLAIWRGRVQWGAILGLIALIALCLAWELWWAPLRAGGSVLMLKAVPLLLPLPGLLKGRRYTYQWCSMFILLWFIEGVMRGWSDSGISQWLALGEIALSVWIFVMVVLYARWTRPSLEQATP
ncbi:hypothetical protein GCM10007860_10940 [Chitiniphilus shinanonensis]|uniref:DUF2069 domain-containing protein n=1 Tax=Chitiniphilus shinanonensis TaxID=553088 RepID=A0ABQ6BVM4_9NEIS|nr:DUF2069 domain-containing protein [Chitiniphilus shinanonensis]GLS03948.1 hypothetical protein GCM10007860_10940 [Chitiniphilus shinanonensis]